MGEKDIAFRRYIVPQMKPEEVLSAVEQNLLHGTPPIIQCNPPSYAATPGFKYDLGKLVSSTSPITSASLQDLPRKRTLDLLKRETALDSGQATALRNSLMRELALTQGPPGCGKTYLGVQLAQTLLQSRKQKPILLVCLTNHALDKFLADLREVGISSLLRIGNGSKEEWTDSINLKNCQRKTRYRRDEVQALHLYDSRKKGFFADIDSLCKGLSNPCDSCPRISD